MAAPLSATSSVEISAPYTLFPLALPLHQTRAKDREHATYRQCFTSPVESKKRKRGSAEVAAAIDGEGLNIYDVRSTQTVSSYALQPATKFSCAPASSITRTSAYTSLRRTYAATILPKKELLCWEEPVQSRSPAGGEVGDPPAVVKPTRRSDEHKRPVVHLQDLSLFAKGMRRKDTAVQSGILAVYADGCLKSFSEDLQTERWSYSIFRAASNDTQVCYVASTSLSVAKKALLRDRSDISLPESSEEDADVGDNIVLFVVTKQGSELAARVLLVSTVDGVQSATQLLCMALPSRADLGSPSFSIHFPSGTLYHLASTELLTYNLTSITPAVTTSIAVPGTSTEEKASILRTSPTTVMVATHESVSLYDMRYSSLQARAKLYPPAQAKALPSITGSLNRDETNSMVLTTYIQDLDLAVGYSQAGIVGVQITRPAAKELVAQAETGSLLIDSIGRGVRGDVKPASKSGVLASMLKNQREKLRRALDNLEAAWKRNDVVGFERVFAEYVGYSPEDAQDPAEGHESPLVNGVHESEQLVNGDETHALVTADTPTQLDSIPEIYYKPLESSFVTKILSMIFAAEDGNGVEKQAIKIFPPNVIKYLLESGNFSTLYLPIQDRLVNTLIEFDPSLRTLQWFLSSPVDLSISEIIAAIGITFSESPNDVVYEVHRTEVLRLSLIRLSTFPVPLVVKSLRMLPGDRLALLIRLLERELVFGSGHPDGEGMSIGLANTSVITELLTVALDAVGITNMVLADSTAMLSALEIDVADAVQGAEEAINLKGLLEELFRHVDWRAMETQEKAAEQETKEKAKLLREKNLLRRARREQRRAEYIAAQAVTEGEKILPIRTAPTAASSVPLPKKKPAALPRSRGKKHHRTREDAAVRQRQRAKLKAYRRALPSMKKKQLREMTKQAKPRALSAGNGASPMLPLGVAALRKMVDPVAGKEVDVVAEEANARSNRTQYWREGLAAGVYSVETMVV